MIALSLSGWHGAEYAWLIVTIAVGLTIALSGLGVPPPRSKIRLLGGAFMALAIASALIVIFAGIPGHTHAAKADAKCASQATKQLRSRDVLPLSVSCSGGGTKAVATVQGPNGCSYTYDLTKARGQYFLILKSVQLKSCHGQKGAG